MALLFSALMSGTAPDAVLVMLMESKHEIFELLEVEALVNTPLIVLLPFIILDFMRSVEVEYIFSKLL